MRHTISVLVENKFGALARIAGLFSGRGFNIDSLTVSPTHDRTMSKMTIVTSGDDAVLEQIDKQLNKLVEVVKVTDLTGSGLVARELMLIKVKTNNKTRSEIIQIAAIFKAKVVHVHHEAITLEVTGQPEKLDGFVELMEQFSIIEIARTGKVAFAQSPQATEELDITPSYKR
ncbi:MAG: acetolactate synthase small subunit [Lentisphaeria bacterium]